MIKNKIYLYQQWSAYLIPVALIFTIFIADLLVIILSIIFLIHQVQLRNIKIFYNRIFVFFFIFWLYLVFNSFLSYDVETSFSRSVPYLRFGFLFLALSCLLNDDKFKENFLKIVLFSLLFLCFDAIFQYSFGFNLMGYEPHSSRMSSFFDDELVMGNFLLRMYPIFLISIIFLIKRIFISRKILLILSIIIYSFCIFLSGERTAFFNFIILNFILSIIFFRKEYFKYLLIFLLFVPSAFLISFYANQNILERYLNLELIKDEKLVIFSNIYQNHYFSAYKIFKAHPISGSGLKSFRKICLKPQFNPKGCATHPHNLLMQFLSELGLIGTFFYLFSFFYFFIKIFKLFINKFKKQKKVATSKIETILIVSIFVSLSPFSPSGSFFNNWISILNFLPLAFLIHFQKNS